MTLPGAFLSLLIAVVGALLVGPLLDTGPRAVIDQALFSAVLIAAVVSVRRQRGQLIAAAAGALAAVGLGWAALVTGDDTIVLAWLLLTVLFLGFVIVSLLGVVFRTRRVVTDTVLGAICIYFLIGYAWGHGFAIIELRRPASFGRARKASRADLLQPGNADDPQRRGHRAAHSTGAHAVGDRGGDRTAVPDGADCSSRRAPDRGELREVAASSA